MPERARLSVASELLADREKEQGPLEQAGQAFLHSMVQSPINGIVQISDRAFGTNALPSVQIIDAPKEAQFGTKEWHAQQIGQAAGMVPWFVGLHKGSSVLIGRAVGLRAGAGLVAEAGAARLGAAEAQLTGRMAEGFLSKKTAVEVGSSALSGLTYGALLMPVKPGEDMVTGRVTNAVSSSLTFATLSASMRGLDRVGVRSYTAAGMLSGVPAGIVAAESHSVLSGKGPASLSDIGKSIYGFSIIGGGFGFAQGRIEAFTGTAKSENALVSDPKTSPAETSGRPGAKAEQPLAGASPAETVALKGTEPQLRTGDVQIPPVPRNPAEIAPGQKVVVRREGEAVSLEVAATTERMVVLREPKPAEVDPPFSVSGNEFSGLTPVEITIDGQVQTRYIMSSSSQIRSSVYKAEPLAGGRFRLTEEPGFSASNRPEVFQWADTARIRSGLDGAPGVDWSLVAEVRAEIQGGLPPQRPGDVMLGEHGVYSGESRALRDVVSLRSRGDTVASCSTTSGTVVLEKPGQAWAAELKDGRCITMESPGPWEVATPVSKRVISKDADGHVKIHDWDGSLLHTIRNPEAPQYVIILGGPESIPVMEALPKGTPPKPLRVTQSSEYGGAKKQWLSDGTRVESAKTGSWEAIRPDGTTFNAESPGPWKIIDRYDRPVSKDAAGVVRRGEGETVRITYPDGTVVRENLSDRVGVNEDSVRSSSTEKPGEPTRITYEDPAVPGQQITQIRRFSPDAAQRINANDFDWEGVRPGGERFNYDSPGPWEVSLPHGTSIAKDAAGNMTCRCGADKVEYRVNGDRVYANRNSTTIYKADNTKYTLYNGCKKWLKESPGGKKSEVDSPPDHLDVPQTALPDRATPMGDPFSASDYW